MRYADSHMHLFQRGFPGHYGAWFPNGGEVRAYESIRKVHPIARSLVVGYERDDWAKGNNAYILKLSQTRDWMAPVAFCFPNAATTRRLTQWRNAGFYGISLYLNQPSDVEQILEWPQEGIDLLNEWKAIISINVPMTNIARLRPFLEKLSQARILISHLGLPEALKDKLSAKQASERLKPLLQNADLPQLGVKISAFYAFGKYPHPHIEPLVRTLCAVFGEKRIYWASDFVPVLDHESFPQTLESVHAVTATLTPQARNNLFHNNLTRAIGRVNRVVLPS